MKANFINLFQRDVYIGDPAKSNNEPALAKLTERVAKYNEESLMAIKMIEEKLHSILNLNYPQSEPPNQNKIAAPNEFTNGGIIQEIEHQVYNSKTIADKLQSILKHLGQII